MNYGYALGEILTSCMMLTNIIKRDVYPQKIHSCSKNVVYHFFIGKISMVYQKRYIIRVIAVIFR